MKNLQTYGAVLVSINEPLQVMPLELPALLKGQVLIELKFSGVCQSQLNEINGLKGEDPYLPHTLGHEASGVVIGMGEGVTKVEKGDHCVVTWIKASGLDAFGTKYGSALGVVNSGPVSTFQKHAIVSENRLVRIPKNISFKEAALLGCCIPTGAGTVFNLSEISKNDSLIIFGIGGVGMSALLAAKKIGVTKIAVVDLAEARLAQAKECGATAIINANHCSTLKDILAVNDGEFFDVSIECSGSKTAMEQAFQCVKEQGGRCLIAGNPRVGTLMEIDPYALIKGKNISGSWGGGCVMDRDVMSYYNMIKKNQLSVSVFCENEYRLEDINIALADLQAAKVLRPLINMSL